jgi:hypothetical protein
LSEFGAEGIKLVMGLKLSSQAPRSGLPVEWLENRWMAVYVLKAAFNVWMLYPLTPFHP